jgi:hypothetical protein
VARIGQGTERPGLWLANMEEAFGRYYCVRMVTGWHRSGHRWLAAEVLTFQCVRDGNVVQSIAFLLSMWARNIAIVIVQYACAQLTEPEHRKAKCVHLACDKTKRARPIHVADPHAFFL